MAGGSPPWASEPREMFSEGVVSGVALASVTRRYALWQTPESRALNEQQCDLVNIIDFGNTAGKTLRRQTLVLNSRILDSRESENDGWDRYRQWTWA